MDCDGDTELVDSCLTLGLEDFCGLVELGVGAYTGGKSPRKASMPSDSSSSSLGVGLSLP